MSVALYPIHAVCFVSERLPRAQIPHRAHQPSSKRKLDKLNSAHYSQTTHRFRFRLAQGWNQRFYATSVFRPPKWSTKPQPGSTTFSIDLRWRIRAYLKLLEQIHHRSDLKLPGTALDDAIYRYRIYMNKICNGETTRWSWDDIPISTQWIWTVHSLNTKSYEASCIEAANIIIPRVNPMPGRGLVSLPRAQLRSFAPTISLEAAVMRQADFYDKVAEFKHASNAELDLCIQNYAKFLRMIASTKRADYVPTVAIDLVWHAHMTEPLAYRQDIERICKRVLYHDDAIAEAHLQSRFDTTALSWFILYKTDYPSTNSWKQTLGKGNDSSNSSWTSSSCGAASCGSTTVGGNESASDHSGGGDASGDAGGSSCGGCGGGD